MSHVNWAHLRDRGVIRVAGSEAGQLLQNVVTNDLTCPNQGQAVYSALLTPQGKLLCDFFLSRHDSDFFIDAPVSETPKLLQRLSMYKLRSDVTFTDKTESYSILVHCAPDRVSEIKNSIVRYGDPRLDDLGQRAIVPTRVPDITGNTEEDDVATYHELRRKLGVPESGKDFDFGTLFPHEALLDQLNGLSMTKGCYVGQEVVSRMHHRGTARKRIVKTSATETLPPKGTEIRAGTTLLGTTGGSNGQHGLALIRLDRAAEAISANVPITASGVELSLSVQPWANFSLASFPSE